MKNIKNKFNFILSITISLILVVTSYSTVGTTFDDNLITPNSNNNIINERIISLPDTQIELHLWDEKHNDNIIPYYGISIDGKNFVRVTEASYELGLRYAHFDPLNWLPPVDSGLAANSDTHLYIVQFFTQPIEEFKETIRNNGGEVYQYIAQFAYLVKMEDSVKEQVEALPYVRWIGPYHPAYRLEEFMIDNYEESDQKYPIQKYNIQVHTIDMKDILANKIRDIGGIVNKANGGKVLIQATLTPEQLFSVANMDEVNFIDRWSEYEADMDIGREIGGADYIETIANYTGEGVRGESFDTGFNLNHVDFQNNPLIIHGPSCGSDSHGTACAGILFGDGTGNANARGLLPDGQGIVADYTIIGLEGQNRYDHSGELIEDPYFAVFQTASVGSGRTTEYTTVSADSDSAIFDFDVVHCQSQSNAGNQMSRPQAWAKNMVSGGAAYHYDTIDKSDDCWCSGASTGPASDGRIKPTFCFFYDDILTVGYPGNNDYTYGFGGTSGATPMTAGHVGLFFQMWSDGIFGNEVDPYGSVFENRAHFTTAKAMLINTAEQYPFNGTSHDLTRMHQGWGMPNLQNMYDLKDDFYIIDEEDILEPFEMSQHFVSVESDEPSLKVTMTYSDLPGNPSVQTQHRINDLTLKVISPSETVYWGNNGLEESVWSSQGGEPDTKNTVECVFVQNPEPGGWTIEVYADEIIEDSHIETPELDADYSLVISPVLPGPYPPEINGPEEGEVEIEYDYTFVTSDPAGGDIYYWIEWGDGSVQEWIGPYASGEIVTVSNSWSENGTYSILAKAKNDQDGEGGWSEPFITTIYAPDLDIDLITGGIFKVNSKIKNLGGADAGNVDWTITLNGGTILLGKETSGTITDIPSDGEVTISSNTIIGFGNTEVEIITSEPHGSTDIRQQNGFVLLFYINVKPSGN
jgi:hypothetical protein